MNRYKSEENGEQISLIPMLDDIISPDCKAQVIDTIVDNMDIHNRNKQKLSRTEIKTRIEDISKRLAEIEILKKKIKESSSTYQTNPDSR